jgi:hypothetical protein
MTLLITTVLPAIGIEIDNKVVRENPNDNEPVKSDSNFEFKSPPPPKWLIGADQRQTSDCGYGYGFYDPVFYAQKFKPAKDKLTAVALEFFEITAPPGIEITVSIRDDLKGNDLTTITVNADEVDITPSGTWVLFDFSDISVTPENTYCIILKTTGAGLYDDSYYWYFDDYNPYDRGDVWVSVNYGSTWKKMDDPSFYDIDFCFITYFKKPLNFEINKPILDFLQNYPNLFSLLQKLPQQL